LFGRLNSKFQTLSVGLCWKNSVTMTPPLCTVRFLYKYLAFDLWILQTNLLISRLTYTLLSFRCTRAPIGSGPPHCRGFTVTLRHTTLGNIPLDEWSARRRDLYLKTHNTQKRQTSVHLAGFEPAIPTSERPQTHALGRASVGVDDLVSFD